MILAEGLTEYWYSEEVQWLSKLPGTEGFKDGEKALKMGRQVVSELSIKYPESQM